LVSRGPLRGKRGMEGRVGRTRGGEDVNRRGMGKDEVGGIAPWLLGDRRP